MATPIQPVETNERIDTGGKTAVQPPTTLSDQLCSLLRNIGFGLGISII